MVWSGRCYQCLLCSVSNRKTSMHCDCTCRSTSEGGIRAWALSKRKALKDAYVIALENQKRAGPVTRWLKVRTTQPPVDDRRPGEGLNIGMQVAIKPFITSPVAFSACQLLVRQFAVHNRARCSKEKCNQVATDGGTGSGCYVHNYADTGYRLSDRVGIQAYKGHLHAAIRMNTSRDVRVQKISKRRERN